MIGDLDETTQILDESEDAQQEESIVVDEAAQDKTVSPIQYDITSYGADYDVEGLVNRLRRGDIIIPPFQRNYVWKQPEASRFIESLLLGLPVPGIFLAREPEENKLLVIDGQQRLKSLQFFYDGFFNPKTDETKKQVFKLLKVQEEFEGKTYDSLDAKYQTKLNDSLIHATIIKQESPRDGDTSIYHIFDRLNSEGRRLTPQEIRTAIDHGAFIDLVKNLNENEHWRNIYGNKSSRLKDQELILRFLAFYFNRTNYSKPMNEFLNAFSHSHRNAEEDFLDNARKKFSRTIRIVSESIGDKAFRPTNAINAAVFDSVMIGIATKLDSDENLDHESLRRAYEGLMDDSEYIQLISQSTSDESNVEKRFSNTIKAFETA